MNSTQGILLGVLLILAGASGCALNPFARADVDGDGRISQAEASGSEELSAVFSSADGNQDGYLDSTELGMAEQLINGWKGRHGEANAAGGGDSHSGHTH